MAYLRNRQPATDPVIVTIDVPGGTRKIEFQEWKAASLLKSFRLVGAVIRGISDLLKDNGVEDIRKIPFYEPVLDPDGKPVFEPKLHPEYDEVVDPAVPDGVRRTKNPQAGEPVLDAEGKPVMVPQRRLNLELAGELLTRVMELGEEHFEAICEVLDAAAVTETKGEKLTEFFREATIGDLLSCIQAAIQVNFAEHTSFSRFLRQANILRSGKPRTASEAPSPAAPIPTQTPSITPSPAPTPAAPPPPSIPTV